MIRLILGGRHVRKIDRIAPFCHSDPRISQACIMLTLFGIVCFLRQRCASGRRFPCGLALRAHLVLSISTSSPPQGLYCAAYDSTASWCASLLLEEEKIVADGGH